MMRNTAKPMTELYIYISVYIQMYISTAVSPALKVLVPLGLQPFTLPTY